jgi:uncharacterized Zn finger protein
MLKRYELTTGCLHCGRNETTETIVAESAHSAVWAELCRPEDPRTLLCPACGTVYYTATGNGESAYNEYAPHQ